MIVDENPERAALIETSLVDAGYEIVARVIGRPMVEPEFWRDVNLVTVRGRPHSPAVGALVREAMRVRWLGEPALAVERTRADESRAFPPSAARTPSDARVATTASGE